MENEINKEGTLGSSVELKQLNEPKNRDKRLGNDFEVYITMVSERNKKFSLLSKLREKTGIVEIELLNDEENLRATTKKGNRKFIIDLISDVSRLKGLEKMNVLSGGSITGSKLIAKARSNGGLGCSIMRL